MAAADPSLLKSDGAQSLLPGIRLKPGSYVDVEGRRCLVDKKQGEHWILIDAENGGLRIFTQEALIENLSKGLLSTVPQTRTGKIAPAAVPPLAVKPKYHAENQRKHAYVQAVLNHPDGFRRSAPWIREAIKPVAEARAEKCPSPNSVMNWVDLHEMYFATHGLAAYTNRHDRSGKPGSRLLRPQERAVELGVEKMLAGQPAEMAHACACRYITLFNAQNKSKIDWKQIPVKHLGDDGLLAPPSLATLRRRFSAVSPDVRDAMRIGPSYSKRRHRTYTTMPVPERPYEHVEVDWTKLDCVLIDDENGIVLGRPGFLMFRDRATAMIVGFSVTYDEPSYAAFMEGLRHATYPKDLSPFSAIKSPYPCWGRIENLYVDNELSFLGDNIRAAGQELGMSIVRLQPRQPWLKGGVERQFRTLTEGVFHQLPGTTLSNAIEKRDYETLGDAALTRKELEALVTYWICEIYHPRKTKGLGAIRGLGGSPINAWFEKVKGYDMPLPPPPDLFLSLAGDVDYRTIQNNGITWDYIVYESTELGRILRHPKHKRSGKGGPTKYKVIRDPYDLGVITVSDHHTGNLIRVEATPAHLHYAGGRTLHQHRVCIAHAKRISTGKVDLPRLEAAYEELSNFLSQIRKTPGRKQMARRMARFWKADEARRHRTKLSVIEPDVEGGDRPMDLTGPDMNPVRTAPETRSSDARRSSHTPAKSDHLALDDDEDLEQLEASLAWETSHG